MHKICKLHPTPLRELDREVFPAMAKFSTSICMRECWFQPLFNVLDVFRRNGRLRYKATLAGLKCWVADSQGQIGCVDLKLGMVQQLLKGAAGSIRSLAIHPSAPLIASAGLDRFLRIHHLASRKSIARLA
jgi:hypothetical protein